MRCQIRKAVVTLLVMSAWMGTALGQWKEYTDAKGVRWQYEEIAAGQSCRIKPAAVDAISGAVDIPASVPDNGVTLSVVEIAEEAFYQCTGLTGVTIPNSVTSIEGSAFASTGLTTVTIPGGVTTIGTFVFDQCNELKRIEVAAESTTFTSVDGVLFSADKSTLVYCPNGRSGTYAVPDGVTTIGATAFAHCALLEGVSLPAGVTRIEASAFQDCNHLKAFTLPQGVEEIGDYAFGMCQKLTEILIPHSVTELGVRAFAGCMGLSKVFLEFNKDCWVKNGAFANIASSPRLYVRDGEERALKGNGNSWWTQFTVIETAIASITVHSNGAKVPEATVKMAGKEVLTDSEGNANFSWLEKQAHSYTVTKAGYKNASGSVDLTAGDQTVMVELEKNLASATFTVRIGGVVVEGALVAVGGGSARTNAAGQVTFSGLERHAYSYTVTFGGYKSASGNVDLTAGDQSVTVELERDLARAAFTVLAGGKVLAGAVVTVGGTSIPTNTDGEAVFEGLERQEYDYAVTKGGYKGKSGKVNLTAADQAVAVELERDLARAAFTVLAGGKALAGAIVTVGGTSIPTNTDGEAVFEGLEKQEYDYTVTKAGYKGKSGKVDLTAGDQAVSETLERDLASVTFTVLAGGKALAEAIVTVGSATMPTNAEGKAVFESLEKQEYVYTVAKAGYKGKSGKVDLTAGDQAVTVELEKSLAHASFAVLASGKPLAGASIAMGGVTVQTNAEGKAILEGFEKSEYDYTVTKVGYKNVSGKVNLAAGDQTVSVVLEKLEAPTPVESVVLRQVTVRPNPVTTELYIDNATDVERLWVASLSGVELLRRENPRGEQTLHVSLEGFAEGAYVLVVESRGEHRALRFVVRH